MQKPLKYESVNWVDGMKLSSGDFVRTDLYTQELVRDGISVGLNVNNFGLLPSFIGHDKSSEILILKKATNYLEVQVTSCNAVTSDGSRIDIPLSHGVQAATLSQFLDTSSIGIGEHYIILQVNAHKRLAYGDPNPEESPLRYPNVRKEYSLSIISREDLQHKQLDGSFLTIGKIVKDQHDTILKEDYICPSTSLSCHPKLLDIHRQYYSMLHDFQKSAYTIMDKTVNQAKITELGINIRMISGKLLDYLATSLFTYRSLLLQQSPIHLLAYFSNFAHVFFNAVRLVGSGEREEMLKYFYEWKDVTPSNFEERLGNVIEQQYNHLEIMESMEAIAEFLTVVVSLWSKLATLEYIGKRRENIVVAEQKVIQEVQTKRTWSLLD